MGLQQHGGRPPYGAHRGERENVEPLKLTDSDFKNLEIWIKEGIKVETINAAKKWSLILVAPTKGLKYEEVDKEIDFKAPKDDNALTTSQIRNVFGEMRRIQSNGIKESKTAFLMLVPKLAYAVKRHNKKGLLNFYTLFKTAHAYVDIENDTLITKKENSPSKEIPTNVFQFENFINVLEAILAYHKYYGGKE